MPSILGSTKPVVVSDDVKKFKIGMIADLDRLSEGKDDDGHPFWKSCISTGSLTYDFKNEKATFVLNKGDDVIITSSYSRGMRGMELSELIKFGGRVYSVCDRTGIVYDVSAEEAIPRVILSDGDGNQPTGFKGEWMTCKDGKLYVGSHGTEFVKGNIITNTNRKWIKEIDCSGAVKHLDWNEKYDAMKKALGCPFPGYLTHESAVWSDIHKQWFFLPRKISKEIFEDKADESRCGNVLLRCSENFDNIQQKTIGTLRPTRGYSSFKFIPGTNDQVIVALKSEEIGNAQKTFITVFTIDGKIILDDEHIEDAKYEGLEFLDQ